MNCVRQRHSFHIQEILRIRGALLLLAMLVAFCAHSFVTQTHLHSPLESGIAKESGTGAGPGRHVAHHGGEPGRSTDCPICQEQAAAGDYLLPTPIGLVLSIRPSLRMFAPGLPAQSCAGRSHCWQSRAPPVTLQR